MNRNARLMLTALFITDIGNGMFNLAIATLLYHVTGSVLAFALVLSSEFVVGILVQLFAGPYVDRSDPKRTMIAIDMMRGGALIAGAAAFVSGASLWLLFAAVVAMNIVKPFYKAANFALTSTLVPDEKMVQLISLKGAASQAGQLVGVALAAPVLRYTSSSVGVIVDGLTFLAAGALTLAIVPGVLERNITAGRRALRLVNDWVEIARILWRTKSGLTLLILSSGDLLFIALLNVFLVPLNQAVADNPFHLSLLDGGFAVGSLGVSLIAHRIIERLGERPVLLGALAVQAGCFVVLALDRHIVVLVAATFVLGIANTLSLAIFSSSLQVRTKGAIKGRISAFRQLVIAVVITATLPIIAKVSAGAGLTVAVLAAAAIILIYLAGTAIAASGRMFSSRFLTDRIEAATPAQAPS